MRAKSHDIQWPVTAKTVENINTNFDTLFESLNAFERAVVSSKGLHEILSAVHSDSITANRIRGDILTAQGTNPKWTRLAKGTTGLVLTMGADDPAWTAHNVLSATHGDTLVGTVVRGDVVIGNATPKWSRLAKGTSGFVLTAGASDVSWATPNHNLLSAIHADSTTASAVRGDLIVAQGVSPLWTRLAKGTAAHVLTMGADEPAWAVIPTQTSALLSAVHTDTTPAAVVRGDVVIGSGASPTWSRLAAGTAGYLLTMGANEPAWTAPATAVAHVMLSATHTDSTPSAAVRGDLISAQGVSPVWARLAASTAGYFLKMGATEPAWAVHGLTYSDVGAAPAAHNVLSATHADTTVASVARGDLITGQGVSPVWTALAKGGISTYLKSDGTDLGWATIAWADVSKTGSSLADLATRAVANLSDGSNVALLNAANSFLLINPLTTIAESWIGPSSTTGIYFKAGNVGIGSYTGLAKLAINGGLHVGGDSDPGDNNLLVDGNIKVSEYLQMGAGWWFGWEGRCHMESFADGYMNLYTSAGNAAGGLIFGPATASYVQLLNDTNAGFKIIGGDGMAAKNLEVTGTTKLDTLGAFAVGDKYVIADASGNLHVSTLGPLA